LLRGATVEVLRRLTALAMRLAKEDEDLGLAAVAFGVGVAFAGVLADLAVVLAGLTAPGFALTGLTFFSLPTFAVLSFAERVAALGVAGFAVTAVVAGFGLVAVLVAVLAVDLAADGLVLAAAAWRWAGLAATGPSLRAPVRLRWERIRAHS
jgi:hypothetical protein